MENIVDKKSIISNYITNYDFSDINKISVKKIIKELKGMLGEEPAVKINWNAETYINEATNEKERIMFIDTIDIFYSNKKYNEHSNQYEFHTESVKIHIGI